MGNLHFIQPVGGRSPHLHVHTCTHIHTCTRIHTYTHVHAYTHTHTWPKALLDLIELNLSLNPLGPEGVSSLLPSLPPQLSRLTLRETCKKNHPITEAMGEHGTPSNKSESDEYWLEYLDLSHCGVNDRGLPTLIGWLERCGELKGLKLAGSSITASGVEPLCG